MRFLFTSQSAWGHVHPMVPLAVALQGRGHDVLWVIGADASERLEQAGIRTSVGGSTTEQRIGEYFRRYPEARELTGQQLPAHMFPRMFGEIAAPRMLESLLPLVADEWRPDIVVHDAAEFAAPIAAASIGVPHVTHGFGDLVPPERDALVNEFVAPLWRQVGLDVPASAGLFEHLYLHIYPPSMRSVPTDHVPRVQSLRPVPFNAVGEERDIGTLARDPDKPLVYLTFGTVFNRNPTFAAAVDGIATLDVNVVATVGPTGDPDAFGVTPDNVRVERYLPQTAVFTQTDLVVSHAGSGTLLGALTEALPQLCLPQAADQFRNAANADRVGVSLSIPPQEATAGAITAAVSRLLSEPAYRTAARGIAVEIAQMPSPDEVAGVLEALT